MPGAEPYQAVQAFLTPIERALACLGTGKVVVSPGGRADTGKTHSWSLNGGDGLVLRGRAAGCGFVASLHYRIIPTDPEKYDIEQGRWRVTTSAYLYASRRSLRHAATDPGIGSAVLHRDGAEPQNPQWRAVLAESEGIHQLYRSWSQDPPPPAAGR